MFTLETAGILYKYFCLVHGKSKIKHLSMFFQVSATFKLVTFIMVQILHKLVHTEQSFLRLLCFVHFNEEKSYKVCHLSEMVSFLSDS